MNDSLLYTIALTMVNGVGGVLSRQLLNSLGDAKSIFQEKRQLLERIPGIGSILAAEIKKSGSSPTGGAGDPFCRTGTDRHLIMGRRELSGSSSGMSRCSFSSLL